MKRLPTSLLTASVLALALQGCKSNEKSDQPKSASAAAVAETPLAFEETVDVSVTAKVKAIDYATRVVTLKGTDGHEVTMVVDKSVARLNEVRVGDDVKAQYRAVILAELRSPTPEESANPMAMVTFAGRSPTGATPSGGVGQAMRVVTTVEAVDVPNMRVTLRGPMGETEVIRGRNPENIKRLRVGETIVITFAESLALSLEKIAPR